MQSDSGEGSVSLVLKYSHLGKVMSSVSFALQISRLALQNTAFWNLQVDVFDDFMEKGFRLEKLRGLAFEVLKYCFRTNGA